MGNGDRRLAAIGIRAGEHLGGVGTAKGMICRATRGATVPLAALPVQMRSGAGGPRRADALPALHGLAGGHPEIGEVAVDVIFAPERANDRFDIDMEGRVEAVVASKLHHAVGGGEDRLEVCLHVVSAMDVRGKAEAAAIVVGKYPVRLAVFRPEMPLPAALEHNGNRNRRSHTLLPYSRLFVAVPKR